MVSELNNAMADAPLYVRLRTAILNGEYRPSAALGEAAVADAYGVSRTPVREALLRLEQDGVLRRVGRQLVVRKTTPEEVLEIYDCRVVLEGMVGEWAARHRTVYDLALLERAHERMVQQPTGTPAEMSATNHAFHDALWKASHNSTLCELLERLEVHILRYPEPTVSQPGRWEAAVAEHVEILDAIKQRDPERARNLSCSHMAAARDLRLRMIQQEL